ncbi:hypothetical protein [Legionella qingyii]|uniref:hypothetical protein n=1 Tax=Legionella qingyii TaxID=2184757 RepID=UPI001402B4E0|nr:hypothetical protein [Legionella qingyii]
MEPDENSKIQISEAEATTTEGDGVNNEGSSIEVRKIHIVRQPYMEGITVVHVRGS